MADGKSNVDWSLRRFHVTFPLVLRVSSRNYLSFKSLLNNKQFMTELTGLCDLLSIYYGLYILEYLKST